MFENSIQKKPERKRGIYLLPNIFTTGGLFAGFYAIVAAFKGHFELAATVIFIAMLLDGFDGRIARLTNTESNFGAEYDSLADMVSFGIAPALVIYSWSLHALGKPGWIAAFLYAAATALRLARFNVQVRYVDKRYFYGLPSPMAAGVIASMVWLIEAIAIKITLQLSWIIASIAVFVALLMVSNIRHYSFKDVDLKGKVPFLALLIVLLTIAMIAWQPPVVLFVIFFGYSLSGLVMLLILWYRRRARIRQRLSNRK